MRALNRKLLRDIWHIKGQALAIAAVIACGVAIVIMTFGAMKSLQLTRDAYYERYRFADIFSQLKRAPLRVARQVAELPGVAAVDARVTHYAALDIPGLDRPAAAYLVSLPDAGEPTLNKIALRSGRLPQRGRDELVMSENMAVALGYGPGRTLSVVLGGRKRLFTVVGVALSPEFVYVLAPGQIMPDDKAFGILWLNRSLMEAAYDMNGAFNDIGVRLAPNASEPQVIQRLDNILSRFGGTAAYGRSDQTSHAFIAQELEQLRTIAFVIPPIFLAVAAFLIHMVLSRLIETERESIGLLKSFGYSNWEVGWHYLKLSLIIAAFGIALGSGVGIWLGRWMTELYRDYFRFPFLSYQLDRSVFAASFLISLAAAVAGTWSAAMRAVRLAPAVAMQPPAPAVYRRTFIDRMGLDRHVSVTTQMILRHITRWPLRALLTSAGVAMSVMLLVSLFFFFDAIDKMVDNFYFKANRQDVVISLVEQRGDRAQFEVSRLPGIRAAEPVLEVPARISHGHLVQRLGITGLAQGSNLRAFYDFRRTILHLAAERHPDFRQAGESSRRAPRRQRGGRDSRRRAAPGAGSGFRDRHRECRAFRLYGQARAGGPDRPAGKPHIGAGPGRRRRPGRIAAPVEGVSRHRDHVDARPGDHLDARDDGEEHDHRDRFLYRARRDHRVRRGV